MVSRAQNPYSQYMLFTLWTSYEYDNEYDHEYDHYYDYDYDYVDLCGEISWLISTKFYAYPYYLCIGFVDQLKQV